jgi:hypothetical protein
MQTKLKEVLSKKTSSEKRMFYRLLSHYISEKQRGNDIPVAVEQLILSMSKK